MPPQGGGRRLALSLLLPLLLFCGGGTRHVQAARPKAIIFTDIQVRRKRKEG